MTRRYSRHGYTLVEVLVVMAILILLGAIVVPSIATFRGDTRPRAAGDVIRGELATARARAKDEGRPYRIAISDDGKRIRRAPDDDNFAQADAFGEASGSCTAVDFPFDDVTASVVTEQDSTLTSANGWTTIATVQPDGICSEDNVLVSLKDNDGNTAIYIRIRGLTGRASVVNYQPGSSTNTNTNTNGGKP
jgi:prepilin-type N-terminal cleavage/methylation domain-containing protein